MTSVNLRLRYARSSGEWLFMLSDNQSMNVKRNILTLFVPGVRRSAHSYEKLPDLWAILPQGLYSSLTFYNFLGRLRLLNYNFENSGFCGHVWVTVETTASNRKIPLYVTYLYPIILHVYIILGTFSVKLQSEKTNSYEKRLQIVW